MSVYVISTPIGNPDDIGHRALDILRSCDAVVGEDPKPTRRLLAKYSIKKEKLLQLNEHTSSEELAEIVDYCKNLKSVALISDAGCPVFCDPGARLIAECRKQNIVVTTVPGPTSLGALLSLSSVNLRSFQFLGFPPRETSDREKFFRTLKNNSAAFIIMDTPYRLQSSLELLKKAIPNRKALLGCNLTQAEEFVTEALVKNLKTPMKKAEFMLLVYPA